MGTIEELPGDDHYSSKMSDKPSGIADSGPETKESTLQEHISCFDAYRDALRRQGYGIVSCHGMATAYFGALVIRCMGRKVIT